MQKIFYFANNVSEYFTGNNFFGDIYSPRREFVEIFPSIGPIIVVSVTQ